MICFNVPATVELSVPPDRKHPTFGMRRLELDRLSYQVAKQGSQFTDRPIAMRRELRLPRGLEDYGVAIESQSRRQAPVSECRGRSFAAPESCESTGSRTAPAGRLRVNARGDTVGAIAEGEPVFLLAPTDRPDTEAIGDGLHRAAASIAEDHGISPAKMNRFGGILKKAGSKFRGRDRLPVQQRMSSQQQNRVVCCEYITVGRIDQGGDPSSANYNS